MIKPRQLEKITKGVANHRRIQMLELLHKTPGLSVQDVSIKLHINYKTSSEHLRRLTASGLVHKLKKGASVLHEPSPLGATILKFLLVLSKAEERTLE